MDKMIEELAKDIHEATRRASAILVEETSAYVKANHHYHSKNDFDKAHPKTLAELEAEYLTEQGYTKQEWISVEDRLPDEYETVLTVYSDETMGMDYICFSGDWFHYGKPTHWMPLPQKPKMKGAE